MRERGAGDGDQGEGQKECVHTKEREREREIHTYVGERGREREREREMHKHVGCIGNGVAAKKTLPKQSRFVREDPYTNEGGSVKEVSKCSKHRGNLGAMASKQTTNATTI